MIAAEHMITAIKAQPGARIDRIVSGDLALGQSFAARHGITRASTDLGATLSDAAADVGSIFSTNEKHPAQAMAAGKHVLCEIPLTMTPAQAAQMVRAAKAAGVVLATNHHLRCAGSQRAIRALIAGGRIGRVLSARAFHAVDLPPHLQSWRINDPAAGGGVIPDITVHDADTVRFLLGEDPVDVVAQAAASGMGDDVEDSVMSVWTLPSGAAVFAHESFTHPLAGSWLEVHGTQGSIFARGVMTQTPVGDIELVTVAGREAVPYAFHDRCGQAVQQFAGAVAGQGQTAADDRDGVEAIAVASAVRASALSGTRLRVDYGVLA